MNDLVVQEVISRNGGRRRGAGRKPNSLNQENVTLRLLAKKYTNLCIEELVKIVRHSPHDGHRLMAIDQILNRGYGRPKQTVEVDETLEGKIVIGWSE